MAMVRDLDRFRNFLRRQSTGQRGTPPVGSIPESSTSSNSSSTTLQPIATPSSQQTPRAEDDSDSYSCISVATTLQYDTPSISSATAMFPAFENNSTKTVVTTSSTPPAPAKAESESKANSNKQEASPQGYIAVSTVLDTIQKIRKSRPPGISTSKALDRLSHTDLLQILNLQSDLLEKFSSALQTKAEHLPKTPVTRYIPSSECTWDNLRSMGLIVDETVMHDSTYGWADKVQDGNLWELEFPADDVLPSQWLVDSLSNISQAVKGTAAATVLLTIDSVLIEAMLHAQHISGQRTKNSNSKSTLQQCEPAPQQRFAIFPQQYMDYDLISLEGARTIFYATLDYIICTSDPPTNQDNVEFNLKPMTSSHTSPVIVKFHKTGGVISSMSELLGAMAIAHSIRKRKTKLNPSVPGICSNGHEWIFCNVNRHGKTTRSRIYNIHKPGHLSTIIGFITQMICPPASNDDSTEDNEAKPETGISLDFEVLSMSGVRNNDQQVITL